MSYEVKESRAFPNHWHVESVGPDGEVYVSVFSGDLAEQRARDYAKWANNGGPFLNPVSLQDYGSQAFSQAYKNGFWGTGPTLDIEELQTKLMLIVGEVAEASECLRKNEDPRYNWFREDGKPEGFCYELADVFIRLADLCFATGVNFDRSVREKMAFNKTRPFKHGKTI